VVPDSSVFTAIKPVRTRYSYNKLSVNNSNIIRELIKHVNRGMYDVSMMKIGLYLNNVAARNHDRLSRTNHNKINKSEAQS
jgi:uncharacterized protein YigE (DUF2233 family)